MSEQIGNAGNIAMAWAERIMLSLPHKDERGAEMNNFTERRHSLVGPGKPFDMSTHTEGLRLLAHRLNDIVPQTQPRRLSKHELLSQDSSPVPATISRTYSDVGMVLPAPAENISLASNVPRREIQTGDSVPLAAKDSGKEGAESSPRINLVKVADKVYRLMRSDLILERERTT